MVGGDYSLIIFGVLFVLLFLAAFPFRNYLEIRGLKRALLRNTLWFTQKPSRVEYCKLSAQNPEAPVCDFCGATRLLPKIHAMCTKDFKWGFWSNRLERNLQYKSFFCTGCGTELFREVLDAA